jgi:transposase InsO family protein
MANQMAVALAKSSRTPPLKLMPGEGFKGNPTDRGLIESFHEELEPGEYRSSEDQPLSLCFQGVGPHPVLV